MPSGDIPGLRGAPVRTPVRSTGAATGPALWPAIAGRMLTRQLWIELYGLPGYGLTLGGATASAFAATPRDPRPVEGGQGKALLGGRFVLAGTSLETPAPTHPWN
ncbi:heparinase, partial [Rhizobium sp. CRIBSB]|nr:heparinase [Rhizobium sp. CRIBSB]